MKLCCECSIFVTGNSELSGFAARHHLSKGCTVRRCSSSFVIFRVLIVLCVMLLKLDVGVELVKAKAKWCCRILHGPCLILINC